MNDAKMKCRLYYSNVRKAWILFDSMGYFYPFLSWNHAMIHFKNLCNYAKINDSFRRNAD